MRVAAEARWLDLLPDRLAEIGELLERDLDTALLILRHAAVRLVDELPTPPTRRLRRLGRAARELGRHLRAALDAIDAGEAFDGDALADAAARYRIELELVEAGILRQLNRARRR